MMASVADKIKLFVLKLISGAAVRPDAVINHHRFWLTFWETVSL